MPGTVKWGLADLIFRSGQSFEGLKHQIVLDNYHHILINVQSMTTCPTKLSVRGPTGLTVSMDRTQVSANDPGLGTPILVHRFGHNSSLACVLDEGELYNADGEPVRLTQEAMEWLYRIEDDANAFVDGDDMAYFRLVLQKPLYDY